MPFSIWRSQRNGMGGTPTVVVSDVAAQRALGCDVGSRQTTTKGSQHQSLIAKVFLHQRSWQSRNAKFACLLYGERGVSYRRCSSASEMAYRGIHLSQPSHVVQWACNHECVVLPGSSTENGPGSLKGRFCNSRLVPSLCLVKRTQKIVDTT